MNQLPWSFSVSNDYLGCIIRINPHWQRQISPFYRNIIVRNSCIITFASRQYGWAFGASMFYSLDRWGGDKRDTCRSSRNEKAAAEKRSKIVLRTQILLTTLNITTVTPELLIQSDKQETSFSDPSLLLYSNRLLLCSYFLILINWWVERLFLRLYKFAHSRKENCDGSLCTRFHLQWFHGCRGHYAFMITRASV